MDSSEPLFDLTKLNELSLGDKEFVQKMIAIFIVQTKENLLILENSVKEMNFKHIHFIAHQMKPTVNILKIEKIKNDLIQLEDYASKSQNIERIKEIVQKITLVFNDVINQINKN